MKNIIKIILSTALIGAMTIAYTSAVERHDAKLEWSGVVDVIKADLGGFVVVPKAPTVKGSYTVYSDVKPSGSNVECYDADYKVVTESSIPGYIKEWYSKGGLEIVAPKEAAFAGYSIVIDGVKRRFANGKDLLDYLVVKQLAMIGYSADGSSIVYKVNTKYGESREWYYLKDGVYRPVYKGADNFITPKDVDSVYYYTTTGHVYEGVYENESPEIKAIIAKATHFKMAAEQPMEVLLDIDKKITNFDVIRLSASAFKYTVGEVNLPKGLDSYYSVYEFATVSDIGIKWNNVLYGYAIPTAYDGKVISEYYVDKVVGGEVCDSNGFCQSIPNNNGYKVTIREYTNPTGADGNYVGLTAEWNIGVNTYTIPVFTSLAAADSFVNKVTLDEVTDKTKLTKCLYKIAIKDYSDLVVSYIPVDSNVSGVHDLVWVAKYKDTVVGTSVTKVAIMPKYRRVYEKGKVKQLTSYHFTGEIYAIYDYDYVAKKVEIKYYDVDGNLYDTKVEIL